MRTPLAALVILGVTAGVSAQSSEVRELPHARSNPDGPILSTGLPLPRIGLPLPPTGLPPAVEVKGQKHQVRRDLGRGGYRRGKGNHHLPPVPVAVVPYFWPYPFLYEAVAPPPPYVPEPAPVLVESTRDTKTGTLYLDVQPPSVQLFVDGYYVGTTDDVIGGLELEAVPHRLEFRAQGYETLVLDVNIPAARVTTYRSALTPITTTANDRPAPTDVVSGPPPTFYVIPGCYVGNVPPSDAGLPASCSERTAVTIQP
jgi:hypothetical protein